MTADTGTYLEIQNRVQTRVIDLPAAVQAEIPQLINEAMYELQTRHNFKCMEAEMYLYTQYNNRVLQNGAPANPTQPPLFTWPGQGTSITPASIAFNVAGGFKQFMDGAEPTFVRYQDGSIRFVSVAPDRRSIYGTFTEGDNAFPSVLLIAPPSDNNNTSTMEVYPLPDGLSDWPDGEYRLQVPYFAFMPNLSANGDSNWLTQQPNGEQFLIAWATAEAFSLDWDPQHEAQWKAKAELAAKRLMNQDKFFRLSPVNELAIHARGQYQGRIRN